MSAWLLDTGPIIAYLDARQTGHREVVAKVDPFVGRLFTTSAVVTEAMHFVSAATGGPRLLVDLLSSWRVEVFDFCSSSALEVAAGRMETYANVPMDFADATLVLLAEDLGVTDVLTLDRRGFRTYRTGAGAAFRLVLDEPPDSP